MNNAKINYPKILKNKTKQEIKEMLETNIFNKNYLKIATDYYVYEICQIDIAIEYNVSRTTIYRVLKKVVNELEKIG